MPGRIPQSFINDLLQRIDIVDLIDTRVKLTKAGKSYKACCPFHQEKTPSFNVNPERGFYKCFGCGASGTAITFLMDHDRMEFVEAIEALAAIAHVEVPREGGGPVERPDAGLYELLAQAAKLYRNALREHPEAIDYLKERGLDGKTAARFGIGFAPQGWDYLKTRIEADPDKMIAAGLVARNDAGRTYDRFRERIMFPIRDSRGRVVAFGGRLMPDAGDGPKYLNSPETSVFHKARELYGLYEARHAVQRGGGLDRLIVVEGYMDVVALAQNGITNAVATLGTAVGSEHFERLYRNTSEVVCCFDGDRAGRQAAWRALEASLPSLRGGRQCKFVFLPDGEDPDSLVRSEGRAHLEEQVLASKPAGDYLVDSLSEGLDLTSMDARARLCELAKPHVSRMPRGVLRRLLVDRLARHRGRGCRCDRSAAGGHGATVGAGRRHRRSHRGRRRSARRDLNSSCCVACCAIPPCSSNWIHRLLPICSTRRTTTRCSFASHDGQRRIAMPTLPSCWRDLSTNPTTTNCANWLTRSRFSMRARSRRSLSAASGTTWRSVRGAVAARWLIR